MAEDDVTLREPRLGEMSWLQMRHMQVMAPAYGWDQAYEAHVGQIIAGFLMNHDPARERFWVAERSGDLLGCIGLTRVSDERARLRLLFVEPAARGMGLGGRLVDACLAFARDAGYAEVVLWTVDVLDSARRLYAAAGFEKIGETASELAPQMKDETWRLRFS
jgi:N-acetylglutamate synthase-like GNAT family acetyltransferase